MRLDRVPVFSLAAAAALAGLCAQATAQGGAAPPPEPGAQPPSTEELLKRLESLEERNKELETRVTDLTRQQGETWIGTQRAEQIREIVKDVLADSDTRSSLQDNGMTAGWNDGFFLQSADGRFRLNLGGFMQTRFTWSNIRAGSYNIFGGTNQYVIDRRDDRYGFGLPNVQLWADGHLFSRDFQYMIKAQFFQQVATTFQKGSTGAVPGEVDYSGFQLLDAWFRVNLDDNWSIRAGQFRTPFSRGFLVQEQYQMSASRSVVDYHYALGYTQGIELEYLNDEFRARYSYNNGDQDNLLGDANNFTGGNLFKVYPSGSLGGLNAPWWTQNASLSMDGRIEWKPAGKWSQFKSYTSPAGEEFGLLVGLGAHWQQSRPYQPNANTPTQRQPTVSDWVALTVDTQANFGGASVYSALFWQYVNAPNAMEPLFGTGQTNTVFNLGSLNILAFELQGAIYFMPKWELFGRYEFAWISGINENFMSNPGAGGNPALQDPDMMNLLTVGVNWYIDGQDVKWTTDFGWSITGMHPWYADQEAGWRPSRSDEVVFRTQIQLMF